MTPKDEMRGAEAIAFAKEHLRKTKTDADVWEIEYVDDKTGETWILDYPDSGLHAGGSPRLRKKSAVAAS